MAESNWYDFLIPSPETRAKIEDTFEEGQLYNRIIGEEGVNGLILRLREEELLNEGLSEDCLLYTSPSPRDRQKSRMPSSA